MSQSMTFKVSLIQVTESPDQETESDSPESVKTKRYRTTAKKTTTLELTRLTETLTRLRINYGGVQVGEYTVSLGGNWLLKSPILLVDCFNGVQMRIEFEGDSDLKKAKAFLDGEAHQAENKAGLEYDDNNHIKKSIEEQKELFQQTFCDPLDDTSRFQMFRDRLLNIKRVQKSTEKKVIPLLVICQSSGHGKSKLMYEHARRHLSAFLCLRDSPNSSGFPHVSQLSQAMLRSLRKGQFDIFLTAYLQVICDTLLSIVESTGQPMNEAAVAAQFLDTQPWLDTKETQLENVKAFGQRVEAAFDAIANKVAPYEPRLEVNKFNEMISSIISHLDQEQKEKLDNLGINLGDEKDLAKKKKFWVELNKDEQPQTPVQSNEKNDFKPILQSLIADEKKAKYPLASNHQNLYFDFLRAEFGAKVRTVLDKTKANMITLMFDEANSITSLKFQQPNGDYVSYFRIIRRSLVDLLLDLPVVAVFADTASTIAKYLVSDLETDDSSRYWNLDKAPPFIDVLFIDHVSVPENNGKLLVPAENSLATYLTALSHYAVDYKSGVARQSKEKKKSKANKKNPVAVAIQTSQASPPDVSLYQYIEKRDPYKGIYLFGRPLWVSNSGSKELLHLAMNKLIRDEITKYITRSVRTVHEDKITLTHQSLAIIGSRTTLFDSFTQTNSDTAALLVKSHMATLIKISPDGSQLHFRYVSEPILAEAAAQIMRECRDVFGLAKLLSRLLAATHTSTPPIITDTGEMGELVAEFILLAARDFASDNEKVPCSPITVEAFLSALVGERSFDAHFKLKTNLSQGLVSFTHFKRMTSKNLSHETVLMDFVGRCAAAKLPANFPKADFFIPIVLADSSISFIFIQVKNHADKAESKSREYFINDLKCMTPTEILTDRSGKLSNIKFSPKFDDYVSLLMSIGTKTRDQEDKNQTKATFTAFTHSILNETGCNHVGIYGVNKQAYPHLTREEVRGLQRMIDASRDAAIRYMCDQKSYNTLTTGTGRYQEISKRFRPLYDQQLKRIEKAAANA